MKVFITGATGYIGHQLTRSLSNQNHEISILVRDPLSERIPKTKNITIHKGDLCDYDSIYKAMNGCDYVFHAAALKQVPSCEFFPLEAVKTNILGTLVIRRCVAIDLIRLWA